MSQGRRQNGGSVVAGLRSALRGPVLSPGEPAYDEARALWNGRVDRRPAAIARCLDQRDVATALDQARSHGLTVAIRGGGHHAAGFALCDGGVVIDLGMMDGIEVDVDRRIVRIGAGVRARALNAATQPHGLATTGAPIVSCGMAGYTLGGGIGWISRKHGLACDNLLSVDVVTAEGQPVRASQTENPDLFWALRGGGGNFGVVTRFEYRLHPVGPDVLAGQIVYGMDAAEEVLRFYREYMPTTPDAFTCMPVVFRLPDVSQIPEPHRRETVLALVPFYDGDTDMGMEVIRPLREVGSPIIDAVGPAPYSHLLDDLEATMYFPGERNGYETAFLDDLPDDAIRAFAEHAAPVPSANSTIFLEWLGGAIARVDHDATAFPHRARRMCLTAVPKWADSSDDAEMIAWATRLFEALAPYTAPGRYVNYLDARPGDGDPSAAAADAYGAHYERLAAVKVAWDPDNVFRSNHNVLPAT